MTKTLCPWYGSQPSLARIARPAFFVAVLAMSIVAPTEASRAAVMLDVPSISTDHAFGVAVPTESKVWPPSFPLFAEAGDMADTSPTADGSFNSYATAERFDWSVPPVVSWLRTGRSLAPPALLPSGLFRPPRPVVVRSVAL